MEDYKEIMKELLLRFYSPIGVSGGNKIHKSTQELLSMFRGVIPSTPITEHDVFEVMKDCSFEIEHKILTKEVCIYEGDEEKGIPAEYDKVEVGRVLLWGLYEL
ncbi:hypothetical protein D1000_07085 [Riemerella anatipestifer]|uniref:hypothetical protein n=1 Tax=Riemerella anatipestifer TaxID=34085 RepID=UPI00129D9106|nr:hypothetical protein [Riemerella anatipestifer]MDR7695372.1 hypothetical protein [Riemerella anatipestifer]MDR7795378.1 hypothetical protein [Riemerella anatipestifer]MRM84383.1 hypothetical protein [Riemerella anatipestifer]MRN16582.1 hypothetical protein [Riemerella anatipestifer]MRQ22709.1 hypothetical protein [Riemerella anatipestifer]